MEVLEKEEIKKDDPGQDEISVGAYHPMQIVLMILLWATLLVGVVGYFSHSMEVRMLMGYIAVLIIVTLWHRSLKLTINVQGISYKALLKSKHLDWKDVKGISKGTSFWATGGERTFHIHAVGSAEDDIAINLSYFRARDLAQLIDVAQANNPAIQVDEHIKRDVVKEHSA